MFLKIIRKCKEELNIIFQVKNAFMYATLFGDAIGVDFAQKTDPNYIRPVTVNEIDEYILSLR